MAIAIDWGRQPLGKYDDDLLAESLGVTPQDVAGARKRLGISACGETVSEPTKAPAQKARKTVTPSEGRAMAFGNKAKTNEQITVKAPNMPELAFRVVGTAPYVCNNFTGEALAQMRDKMVQGDKAKGKNARKPKDFQRGFEESKNQHESGWCGIPAPAIRSAMISACRVAGLVMTKAKLTVFVEADGYSTDHKPLVKITKGKPEYFETYTRNANGSPDLRARAMFKEGWEALVRIRFDADQIDADSVANLLQRAGLQVGIGAGRPDSKDSTGQGWGTFTIKDEKRGKGRKK